MYCQVWKFTWKMLTRDVFNITPIFLSQRCVNSNQVEGNKMQLMSSHFHEALVSEWLSHLLNQFETFFSTFMPSFFSFFLKRTLAVFLFILVWRSSKSSSSVKAKLFSPYSAYSRSVWKCHVTLIAQTCPSSIPPPLATCRRNKLYQWSHKMFPGQEDVGCVVIIAQCYHHALNAPALSKLQATVVLFLVSSLTRTRSACCSLWVCWFSSSRILSRRLTSASACNF